MGARNAAGGAKISEALPLSTAVSEPRVAANEAIATRKRLRLKLDENRNRSMIHRYPHKLQSTKKFALKLLDDLATLLVGSYSKFIWGERHHGRRRCSQGSRASTR